MNPLLIKKSSQLSATILHRNWAICQLLILYLWQEISRSKVICEGGIEPGVPLVTSNESGYAMKLDLDDPDVTWKKTVGAVFAKVITGCDGSDKYTQIRGWLNVG